MAEILLLFDGQTINEPGKVDVAFYGPVLSLKNLVVPEYPMLHTKFQDHWLVCSGEDV